MRRLDPSDHEASDESDWYYVIRNKNNTGYGVDRFSSQIYLIYQETLLITAKRKFAKIQRKGHTVPL